MTEFKRVYFGTVLGYLWSLIRPLMLFGVLLFVFTQVFKIGSEQVEHYPVMLLLGIVLFTFFQEATTNAVTSVVAQEGVVRKTQFPRLVIPLSTVLTGAFNLGLNLVVVLVFILAFGVDPTWTWLLFPVALCCPLRPHGGGRAWRSRSSTCASATSRSSGPSSRRCSSTRPRSSIRSTPSTTRRIEHLLMINPLAVIFEQVRVWILAEPEAPTAVEAAGGVARPAPGAAIFVGVCVFGVWIFNREAPRIAEDL